MQNIFQFPKISIKQPLKSTCINPMIIPSSTDPKAFRKESQIPVWWSKLRPTSNTSKRSSKQKGGREEQVRCHCPLPLSSCHPFHVDQCSCSIYVLGVSYSSFAQFSYSILPSKLTLFRSLIYGSSNLQLLQSLKNVFSNGSNRMETTPASKQSCRAHSDHSDCCGS